MARQIFAQGRTGEGSQTEEEATTMRAASSYRSARKKMAKEAGMPLHRFNMAYDVAARAAEGAPQGMGDEAARKKLALWAASGGRETPLNKPISDEGLKRMNDAAMAEDGAVSDINGLPTVEEAVAATKKITVADVDKALETALTLWQTSGREDPLPLSRLFAARARQLGWAEDVEFLEEK